MLYVSWVIKGPFYKGIIGNEDLMVNLRNYRKMTILWSNFTNDLQENYHFMVKFYEGITGK